MDRYLSRIGFDGVLAPDLACLKQLHFLHATHIPFENLDIQQGLPISLDLESLQNKLVEGRRGGYCFEQNTVFLAVLRKAGFSVMACEARVRMGTAEPTARTHMMLLVTLNETVYLCDVGFGGEGLLYPVPLDGEPHEQFLWQYRVVTEGPQKVLQSRRGSDWVDLYAFYPEPRFPIDFEVANWYTSTHPQSRFVLTLTAQLPTPEARYILRNKTLLIERGESQETRQINTREELLDILKDRFGLNLPGTLRLKHF